MAKDLKIGALLDVYGPFLSQKQRTLCEHYYNEDLSLAEIAENEQITRQGVRDIIHRATVDLENFEKECHYYEKFASLKQLAGDFKNNQDKIKDIINNL